MADETKAPGDNIIWKSGTDEYGVIGTDYISNRSYTIVKARFLDAIGESCSLELAADGPTTGYPYASILLEGGEDEPIGIISLRIDGDVVMTVEPGAVRLGGGQSVSEFTTDTDLDHSGFGASNIYVPTELAVKSYVDNKLSSAAGVLGRGARAYNSTTQSISNATWTTVTFDSEAYDSASMHSLVSNTGRLTFGEAGRGLFEGNLVFAANSTGQRAIRFRLNGSTVIGWASQDACGGGLECGLNLTALYNMAQGDYVEVQVWQNSGGSLNLQAPSPYYGAHFAAHYLNS